MVGEQPLTVAGAPRSNPSLTFGLDAEGGDAGAHGGLQVEQGIKPAPLEGLPEIAIAAPPLALVEGNDLDLGRSANRVASILPVIQVMRVWGHSRWMTRTSAPARGSNLRWRRAAGCRWRRAAFGTAA